MKKITIPYIKSLKNKEKISVLTAYSAKMASLIDNHVDIILVGDSLAMTLHGLENTLQVTMDMMILAGKAVNRGRKRALLVVDMPFSSYENDVKTAYDNAARIIQETGAEAVKLEGAGNILHTIEYLTSRNIPVMAHLGLQPQNVNNYGGYGVRGRTDSEKQNLLQNIISVENAGAFCVVIEAVTSDIANEMTMAVKIPTIGIGASDKCDGQVLVTDDLLGLTEKTAKFVKKYDDFHMRANNAIDSFAKEVKNNIFPNSDYLYE